MRNFYFLFIFSLISLFLSACSTVTQDGAPSGHVNFDAIPNAVPKVLPLSRYGNPSHYKVAGRTYYVRRTAAGFEERGIASWYGTKFHGQLTSTRNRYNLYAMTAAMPTLPIPSFVEVTNLENGRKVIVEVNDRGPFKANRIIDLSYAAAGKLGIYPKGTGLVEVRAIDPRYWNSQQTHPYYVAAPRLKRLNNPQLYIQVGAFSETASANRVVAQIHREINRPARIEARTNHGIRIYRVQVGPLPSVSVSDSVSKRLERLGYRHPISVIE